MKFKIRFADQIVGIFIILSLVSVVAVIVLLGRSQRWFADDLSFTTVLPSAAGLSKNMPVQYKGFAIGNVTDYHLTDDDDVEVFFTIFEEYCDRMRMGSMMEIVIGPIPVFGNEFLLHIGRGEPLAAGSFVPLVGSAQARELIRQGLAIEPYHDDSISLLINKASSILVQLDEALGPGSNMTEIGQIFGSVKRTVAGLEPIPPSVEGILEDLKPKLDGILTELEPIMANINAITSQINDPDNLIFKVLDTDEEVYTNLVNSLGSLSSILDNLDKTTAGMFPNIAGLIMELRGTIKSVEDVLVALTNNPLLRRGVPERVEGQSGGSSPRDIQF